MPFSDTPILTCILTAPKPYFIFPILTCPPRPLSSLSNPHLHPSSYACSRSGHVLELDSQCLAVRHARRLLPAQAPSSPVTQKQASGSGQCLWPLELLLVPRAQR